MTPHAGFFNKAIFGSTILEDNIFGASRQAARDLGGLIIGECVVDPTNVGLGITASADALNDRRLTVTGDLPCLDEDGRVHPASGSDSAIVQLTEGSRVITLHDPDWFVDLPYENDSGQTYRVYITGSRFPIDVGIGKDGGRGYSRWMDAPAVSINPSSVVDQTTYLELRVTTGLTDLGVDEWLTANSDDPDWSFDCVVYLDTDVAGVQIAVDDPDVAIAFGAKLVKRAAGGWMVQLDGIGDGYLGQSSPSLTGAHYRIIVLGPLVTNTNFDSNPSYIHVGTVLSGVSETIDVTAQRIVNSVSQALVDAATVPDALLPKGWLTRPSVTFNAASVDFGTGEAFVIGSTHDTSADSVGSLTVGSTLYLYWDSATDSYAFSATYNTANGVGNLLIARVETDGGGNITLGTTIGRMVREFFDSNVLTVSGDSAHHAMFTTIKEALAWAASRNTIGASDTGWVIELVGNCTVTETIGDADLVGIPGVTFRSRGGQSILSGTGSAVNGQAITWTMDDPLFSVPSGTTLRNWRFEGINFKYQGTGTTADTALINNAGNIEGLEFVGCLVNGNDVLGSNVYLPHVVYSTAGLINGLIMRDCRLYSAEAVVWVTAAAQGSQNVQIRDCLVQNDSAATTLSQAGFITDLGTAAGEPLEWMVKGNRCKNLQGHGIYAWALKDSFISDNYLKVVTDHNCLRVGNSTTPADTNRLIVKDNIFLQDAPATVTEAIVRIFTQDTSAADKAHLILHDNIIDGTDTPAGSVGLQVSSNTTANGTILHDNLVNNVVTGITTLNLYRNIMHDNVVHASLAGMYAETGGGINGTIIGHNSIYVDGGDAVALEIDFGTNEFQSSVIACNLIDFQNTTGDPFGFKSDSANELNVCCFIGNLFHGETSNGTAIDVIDANDCVFTGNLIYKGHIEFEDCSNMVFAGNGQFETGWDCLFNASSPNVVASGNYIGDNMMFRTSNNSVVSGNYVAADLQAGITAGIVANNYVGVDIDMDVTGFEGTNLNVIGNFVNSGTLLEDAASDNGVVVGNRFNANVFSHQLTQAEGTWTGNKWDDDVTLTADVTGGLFVGNQVDGTLTNSSTGSTVASNEN